MKHYFFNTFLLAIVLHALYAVPTLASLTDAEVQTDDVKGIPSIFALQPPDTDNSDEADLVFLRRRLNGSDKLRDLQVGEENLIRLAMKYPPQNKELSLQGIVRLNTQIISHGLEQNNSNLFVLEINLPLTDNDMLSIARGLARNTTIYTLGFHNTLLNNMGIITLLSALNINSNVVRTLVLANNTSAIRSQAALALSVNPTINPNLTILLCNSCLSKNAFSILQDSTVSLIAPTLCSDNAGDTL